MPEAFVFTTLPLGDVIEPLPPVTANVTATPDTGLLVASRTITDGAIATGLPAVADWVLPAFNAICVAAPTVPVAVKVTGLPVRAPAVAVRVFVPTAVP